MQAYLSQMVRIPKQALDEATNDITQNIKILHPSQNDKKGD